MEGIPLFAISHNIPEIRDKLKRIKILLGSKPTWQDDMVNQMQKSVRDLRRLTPRSEGIGSQEGGRHLATGWMLHTIGRGGKDRIPVFGIVYNDFTHEPTGEVKEGAGKFYGIGIGVQRMTLLHYLEYGTRPHVIRPVDKEYLHFTTREGDEVFTKRVDHPGTKPYGMIRVTRAKLKMRMRKFTARWARKVAREWGKD